MGEHTEPAGIPPERQVKFVVDANCMISVLMDTTGKTLALYSQGNRESWLPALRAKVVSGFENGILIATEALKKELGDKSGKLGRGKEAAASFINGLEANGVKFESAVPEDAKVIEKLNQIVREDFEAHQADGFLRGKDCEYIAVAKRLGASLATLESQSVQEFDPRRGKIRGKPRIPYIAWRLGVRTVGLYYVLQQLDQSGQSPRIVSSAAGS